MDCGGGAHAGIDARLSGGVASGAIFEEGSFENFSDAPAVPIQCADSVERVGEMQRHSKFTVRPWNTSVNAHHSSDSLQPTRSPSLNLGPTTFVGFSYRLYPLSLALELVGGR
jgi:hypothetical protein